MRRALPVIFAVAATALMAGCATMPPPPPMARPAPPPPPPPPPTPIEEFAWSGRPGQNTLVGVMAYRPAPNQTWSCTGQSIALTPETSYSRGRMVALYGSADRAMQTVASVRARSAANPGIDYAQFVRSTTCDAQQGFTFRELPDGAYYVIARVRQTRPVTTGDGMVIMQRVELRGGQAVRMTLPQGMAAAQPRPAPARTTPPRATPRRATPAPAARPPAARPAPRPAAAPRRAN